MNHAMKPIQKLLPIVFHARPRQSPELTRRGPHRRRVINVEKVDLVANTYKLDFFWFSWYPTQITLKQIQDFEFLNGSPSKDVVFETEEEGFVQYRVKVDFLKTFDFT